MRNLIKISSLFGLIFGLLACSEVSNGAPLSEVFINMNNATTSISIEFGSLEGSVVLEDVVVTDSRIVNDKQALHIMAKDFGIAISIPSIISAETPEWEFQDCIFTPDEFARRRISTYPKVFSFTSFCKDPETHTNYLLSHDGKLIAFEIFEKKEDGTKGRSVVYVNAKQGSD